MKFLWPSQTEFMSRAVAMVIGCLICSLIPLVSFAIRIGPSDIKLSKTTFNENMDIGGLVAALSTTDIEGSVFFIYKLVSGDGDADNSLFKIEENGLYTAALFDYETRRYYSVRIRSTNLAGLSVEKSFTLEVLNKNDKPTYLWLEPYQFAENKPAGSTVGRLYATDPDAGETLTFTILDVPGSPDYDSFTIVGKELRATEPFNFEVKTLYSLFVRVTDSGGLSYERNVNIFVTNVNDAPIDIVLSNNKVGEHQPVGTAVGTVRAVDEDLSQKHTSSLVSGDGSTDNAKFTLVKSELRTAAIFNYEKSSYRIRLRVTDNGGLSFEKAFVIAVTNVNENPTGISLSNSSVAENQPAGTIVGTFNAADPDEGDTFLTSLVAGAGDANNASFSVNRNVLRTARPFDFEGKTASRSIRARVTDKGGLTYEKSFVISITNVNETPTDILLSNQTIAENLPPGTLVGEFSAVDPDAGNSFTFTLYPGNGHNHNEAFSIVGNRLYMAKSIDYEINNNCRILVKTRDQGGLYRLKTFTLSVSDVDEPNTLRVNCGNGAVSDWSADTGFAGGIAVTGTSAIANATRAPGWVYRTARKGSPDLSYDFATLPDGHYKVRLHLAELIFNAEAKRKFNVFIEGIQVLTNLDVFARAGGKDTAYTKTFDIDVSDGNGLQIDGVAVKAAVVFNGIQVWPVSGTSGSSGAGPVESALAPDSIRTSASVGEISEPWNMADGDLETVWQGTPADGGGWVEYAYDQPVVVSDVAVIPEAETAGDVRFLGRSGQDDWFDLEGEVTWFGEAEVDAVRVLVPPDTNGEATTIREIRVQGVRLP